MLAFVSQLFILVWSAFSAVTRALYTLIVLSAWLKKGGD